MDPEVACVLQALIRACPDKLKLLEAMHDQIAVVREDGEDALETQLAEWEAEISDLIAGELQEMGERFGRSGDFWQKD